ncbi:hypothetical protein C9374_001478 [Naegleria lovaniensis]|uniref:Uncharacterized protein n=1 Tax=Naegleria lovaniensis TaxID=51637 RepID=A0AA88KN35_NAELO|nr:uncharacterized protein C9374_001478 [Naegleria lovaniensis]KAG2387146.1 hypothetical protein C9374_001478 [Naegleria lovaniensis]
MLFSHHSSSLSETTNFHTFSTTTTRSLLLRSINVTQSSIPSTAENIGALCNSAIFIVALSSLMGILLSFYIRARHEMKFKQKILFFLTGVLVVTEIVALVLRVVYNSTAEYMNGYDWRRFPNLLDYMIVEWVFSVMENALAFFAIVNITVITGFLQDMFLTTATAAGTISKKYYALLRWSLFSINMICSGVMAILVILNAIMNLLARMTLLNSSVVVPVQIILLVIYCVLSLMNLTVFCVISLRLLWYVRKTSRNVSAARDKESSKFMTKPFTKICGLMLGMLLSSFLQIVSAIVSFFTSNYANYLHVLDYLLQALGVLVFAVFVMLLYIPLWNDQSDKDARNYVLNTCTNGRRQSIVHCANIPVNSNQNNCNNTSGSNGDTTTTSNEITEKDVMTMVEENYEKKSELEMIKEEPSPATPSLQHVEMQEITINDENNV